MSAQIPPTDGNNGDSGDRDERIARIVEEFAVKAHQGNSPMLEEYLKANPDIADELQPLLMAARELATDGTRTDPANARRVSDGSENYLQERLGDFQLVRRIGQGGMGTVYEAIQVSLNKRVALKTLVAAGMLDSRQRKRFQNEAQAAAQLDHPNIVPVFAMGQERGTYYYAMQLIDGANLAEIIASLRHSARKKAPQGSTVAKGDTETKEKSQSSSRSKSGNKHDSAKNDVLSRDYGVGSSKYFRRVAELAVQACQALEAAHDTGIIHRDIKPHNMLVDENGHLWITDFGLAMVANNPSLTRTGEQIGTIRYMSPEQALAKRVTVDHRTDIYSLGVTLYELLCLRRAFDGTQQSKILRQIAFEEHPKLTSEVSNVPSELAIIIEKAMSFNPDHRYQSAEEMAADLRCFLNDKPIKARPPTLAQKVARWGRHHKQLAKFGAFAFGVMLIAAIFVGIAYKIAADEKVANAQREARILQGKYLVSEALLELPYNAKRALQMIMSAVPIYFDSQGRSAAIKGLDALYEAKTLWFDAGSLGDVSFSNSGTRLVACSARSHETASGSAIVYDLETQTTVTLTRPNAKLTSAAFSPADDYLITSSPTSSPSDFEYASHNPGDLVVWSLETKQSWEVPGARALEVTRASFHPSPEVTWFVCGDDGSNNAAVWDYQSQDPVLPLQGHKQKVVYAAFAPSGKQIVTASLDGTAKIWNVDTTEKSCELVATIPWTFFGMNTVESFFPLFDESGERIYSRPSAPEPPNRTPLLAYITETGARDKSIVGAESFVALHPNGSSYLAASFQSIWIYNLQTNVMQATYSIPGTSMTQTFRRHPFALSGKGDLLAAATPRQSIAIWNTQTGGLIGELLGAQDEFASIEFAPDGRLLATTSKDGSLRIWHTRTGAQRAELSSMPQDSPGTFNTVVEVSHKSNDVFVARPPAFHTTVYETSDLSTVFDGPGLIRIPSRAANSQHFLLRTDDDVELVSEYEITSEIRHFAESTIYVFAKQGNDPSWAAIRDVGRTDAELRLEGNSKSQPVSITGQLNAFAVHPQTNDIYTACQELDDIATNVVRRWSSETGGHLNEVYRTESHVNSIDFSASGEQLLIVSSNQMELVDVATGELIGKLPLISQHATSYGVHRSRDELITVDAESMRIWNASTGEEVRSIAMAAPRVITLSPAGRQVIVTAGEQQDVTTALWNYETGKSWPVVDAHVAAASISPDGKTLAIAPGILKETELSHVKLFTIGDDGSPTETKRIEITRGDVQWLGFPKDGDLAVAVKCYGGWIQDAAAPGPPTTIRGHAAFVAGAEFSPDGRSLCTVAVDGSVAVWNRTDGELEWIKRLGHIPLSDVRWNPRGDRILVAGSDGSCHVLDASTQQILGTLPKSRTEVQQAEFDSLGNDVMVVGAGKRAWLWQVESRTTKLLADQDGHAFENIAFARKRRHSQGMLLIRNQPSQVPNGLSSFDVIVVNGAKEVVASLPHTKEILHAEFSPSGEHIITAAGPGDCSIRIWNADDGRLVRELAYQPESLCSIALVEHTKGVLALLVETTRFSVWSLDGDVEWFSVQPENSFSGRQRPGQRCGIGGISGSGDWIILADSNDLVRRWPVDPVAFAREELAGDDPRPPIATGIEQDAK